MTETHVRYPPGRVAPTQRAIKTVADGVLAWSRDQASLLDLLRLVARAIKGAEVAIRKEYEVNE